MSCDAIMAFIIASCARRHDCSLHNPPHRIFTLWQTSSIDAGLCVSRQSMLHGACTLSVRTHVGLMPTKSRSKDNISIEKKFCACRLLLCVKPWRKRDLCDGKCACSSMQPLHGSMQADKLLTLFIRPEMIFSIILAGFGLPPLLPA